MKLFNLSGKTAVITGASSGLGMAITLNLTLTLAYC
jgi:NAD(P)-dependent dehydrogenase (short-subunit alcohol dehydrogenase family)